VPRSALIVAVPEAEPLVGEWRLRYDNASLDVPAHVTLLFPFMPAGELGEALFGELRALFAAQAAFTVAFSRVARLTDVAWLALNRPSRSGGSPSWSSGGIPATRRTRASATRSSRI
jgi:hypothetical protein